MCAHAFYQKATALFMELRMKIAVAVAAAMMSLHATAQDAPGATTLATDVTASWCRTLDTAPPDQGIAMCLDHSGKALYYLSNVGSTVGAGESGFPKDYTDVTTTVYYGGEAIATAAPYEGASYNNNLNLLKTDLDGNFVWTVYSTSGEAMSNNGGVAATPDGGVVLAATVRHTDNMRTEPLRLVDATGAVTTIDWTLPAADASRHVQGLLVKVSADGAIEWTRLIEVSREKQPTMTEGTITSLAFYLNNVVPAQDGGFVLTGRYVNPITMTQVDGTPLTLTPHNTEGWTGDSQSSRGDIFVAHFDAEGLLVNCLTTTGIAQVESMPTIARTPDGHVLNFMAAGDINGNSAITLLGHEIALPTTSPTMITARLNDDFTPQWVQTFATEGVGGRVAVMQNNHVNLIGDNLWLTGMGNFTLYSEDASRSVATATGGVREGYLIKCDAATGRYVAAVASKTAVPELAGIVGYMGAFESESDNNVYVYGYHMGTDAVMLTAFDKTSLAVTDRCTLIAGGNQPTTQEMLATGTRLYTMSRGQTIYNEYLDTRLKPLNSDIALEARNWAAVFAGFDLPFTALSGQDIEPESIVGDVNGDGVVNANDVALVVNIIAGTETDAQYVSRADLNSDGAVNSNDIAAVVNIIAGM